ncbi:energy transducer TonB [Chryseobacterium viscerum]|uniref:TonB C-terminal domain-containing protein n=1 Tax=Chryseobacterium viscerum TaxID=1037377 RepID=A0A5N4BTW3_9FLAO|nr:energy transducer TonB [Chryseobacterium viscerum]KAB1231841.1 hypothetical protein F8D52_04175 [Chryseobacterium viscerum]
MKKISILILLLGTQFAFSQTIQKEEQQTSTLSSEVNKDEISPVEYPGGMIALRQDISQIFDPSKFESSSGISKSITKFDINPDGSISSISTTGNNPALNKEMDRVIKALKTKWKPATKNGQAVKATYRIPMTLNL